MSDLTSNFCGQVDKPACNDPNIPEWQRLGIDPNNHVVYMKDDGALFIYNANDPADKNQHHFYNIKEETIDLKQLCKVEIYDSEKSEFDIANMDQIKDELEEALEKIQGHDLALLEKMGLEIPDPEALPTNVTDLSQELNEFKENIVILGKQHLNDGEGGSATTRIDDLTSHFRGITNEVHNLSRISNKLGMSYQDKLDEYDTTHPRSGKTQDTALEENTPPNIETTAACQM